jgi:outer membrane protein
MEQVYQQALSTRADIRQLEFQRDATDAAIDAEFSAHLPKLAAVGQLQIQSQSETLRGITFSGQGAPVSSFVGFQLSLPIFNGFKTDARVQQAKFQREQTTAELDLKKRQLKTELQTLTLTLRETAQRIESERLTITLAERSYAAVKSRYQKGLAKQLDVSDAALTLAQSKGNFLQAVYEHLVAKANYERAMAKE